MGREAAGGFHRAVAGLFHHLTVDRGLDNVLWIYSPNAGEHAVSYYPGSDWVDVAALDVYTDEVSSAKLTGYADLIKLGKPFRPRGIRTPWPAEPAGRLRLPPAPGRHPRLVSAHGLLPVLERGVESRAQPFHPRALCRSAAHSPGRSAAHAPGRYAPGDWPLSRLKSTHRYSTCSKPVSSAIFLSGKSVSRSSCPMRLTWTRRISAWGDRPR